MQGKNTLLLKNWEPAEGIEGPQITVEPGPLRALIAMQVGMMQNMQLCPKIIQHKDSETISMARLSSTVLALTKSEIDADIITETKYLFL